MPLVPVVFHGFDWDAGNGDKNCKKHGLPKEEIEAVLRGRVFATLDAAHSVDEQRYLVIGRGRKGRPVFMVFTVRHREGKAYLRPISARYMHAKEVRYYEKAFLAEDEDRPRGPQGPHT
jgi:uncharacterized DUF497 family protein